MAKATKKKAIAKSAAINTRIDSALNHLVIAHADAGKAQLVRTSESKKLVALVKRLNKKRAALAKRKVTAASRLKKAANSENKKSLAAVVKELASVRKELTKYRIQKSVIAAELAAVKAGNRKVTSYVKAIAKIDKVLSKSAKKRKK